jgi:hypothetical protein
MAPTVGVRVVSPCASTYAIANPRLGETMGIVSPETGRRGNTPEIPGCPSKHLEVDAG